MSEKKKRILGAKPSGAGVMAEFTVIAPVLPGHEKAIREVLTMDPETTRLRDEALQQIATLHEARFVLLDNDTRVQFASSFDGDWDKYIDDFGTSYVGLMFDAIFSHCPGWPGVPNVGTPQADTTAAKDWLMGGTIQAMNYYNQWPNASVKEITRALELQKAFEQVLDNPGAAQALSSPMLKPLLSKAAA